MSIEDLSWSTCFQEIHHITKSRFIISRITHETHHKVDEWMGRHCHLVRNSNISSLATKGNLVRLTEVKENRGEGVHHMCRIWRWVLILPFLEGFGNISEQLVTGKSTDTALHHLVSGLDTVVDHVGPVGLVRFDILVRSSLGQNVAVVARFCRRSTTGATTWHELVLAWDIAEHSIYDRRKLSLHVSFVQVRRHADLSIRHFRLCPVAMGFLHNSSVGSFVLRRVKCRVETTMTER
mmetsp:Transcript_661/g.2028  ORF Transcript_661/g.2028 Transcript_661/m.2028 type:complete len:237 (+) Transcript_661:1937-2647(+)